MEFYIGQTFDRPYPPQAAAWCNENDAHLEIISGSKIQIAANDTPKPEDILLVYENAVQKFLDETAQGKGYDNTYTCLSYLSSTNTTWYRESHIFNAWRDEVWQICHRIMDDFFAGKIPQPTIDEVIAQFPEINWESEV